MTNLTAIIGRCLIISFVLLKVYQFEPLFLALHTGEAGRIALCRGMHGKGPSRFGLPEGAIP